MEDFNYFFKLFLYLVFWLFLSSLFIIVSDEGTLKKTFTKMRIKKFGEAPIVRFVIIIILLIAIFIGSYWTIRGLQPYPVKTDKALEGLA